MTVCDICDIAYIEQYAYRAECPLCFANEKIEKYEKTIEELNDEISSHECSVEGA